MSWTFGDGVALCYNVSRTTLSIPFSSCVHTTCEMCGAVAARYRGARALLASAGRVHKPVIHTSGAPTFTHPDLHVLQRPATTHGMRVYVLLLRCGDACVCVCVRVCACACACVCAWRIVRPCACTCLRCRPARRVGQLAAALRRAQRRCMLTCELVLAFIRSSESGCGLRSSRGDRR